MVEITLTRLLKEEGPLGFGRVLPSGEHEYSGRIRPMKEARILARQMYDDTLFTGKSLGKVGKIGYNFHFGTSEKRWKAVRYAMIQGAVIAALF